LIDEFGWRGAILIEAGIILNCVLCGALFRPLEHPKVSQNSDTAKKPPLDSQLVKDSLELELFVSNGTTVTSQPSSPTRDITPFSLEPPHKDTAIFRSDGALHRSTHKPMTPSPLTMDQTQGTTSSTQPHLRRLLSEEHHYHHHRHSNQHAPFRSHRNLVLGK
jgi:hypothetical protein